jgi:hypothetical protein
MAKKYINEEKTMDYDKIALEELRQMYPHGHPDFLPKFLAMIKLHSEKNHDYAKGGNPLGNFNRVSNMLYQWGFGLPPYAVAMVYILKQVDCVGNMIGQDYEGSVEGISGRLQDIAVYATLIDILYKEAQCQRSSTPASAKLNITN